MTKVVIHGKLGQKYGKNHQFVINKPKDVLLAMDANHPGFLRDYVDSVKAGSGYFIVSDGVTVLSKESAYKTNKISTINLVPNISGRGEIVGIILSIVLAVVSYAMNRPEFPEIRPIRSTSQAMNKSFTFTNSENVAEQGNPVPLGYGRLRIGSTVIQSTMKNFPARFDDQQKNSPIYTEFSTLATKRGLAQMGIIDTQDLSRS